MFVKDKELGTIYSASPLEDMVAIVPIAGFVKAALGLVEFVHADVFCTKFERVSPTKAREEYREMKEAG